MALPNSVSHWFRIFLMTCVGAAVVILGLGLRAAALAPAKLQSAEVVLISAHTGRFLDGDWNGTVDQSTLARSDDHWLLDEVYPGSFSLKNVQRLRYLDGDVHQHNDVNLATSVRDDRTWTFVKTDGSALELRNREHDLLLHAEAEKNGYGVNLAGVSSSATMWYVGLAGLAPDDLVGSRVVLSNAYTGRFLHPGTGQNVDQSRVVSEVDEWLIERVDDDVAFRNASTGQLLHATAGGTNNVELSSETTGSRWKIEQLDDGTYRVLNVEYQLWLDADKQRENFNVDLTPDTVEADGRWNILVVGGSDTTPPTAPGVPQLTSSSSTSLTFSWTESSDDNSVSGYRIYLDSDLVTTAGAEPTKYTIDGLYPDTTYTIGIQALDAAGNASTTSTAEFTTGKTEVCGPVVPTFSIDRDSRLTLSDDESVARLYSQADPNCVTSTATDGTVVQAPNGSGVQVRAVSGDFAYVQFDDFAGSGAWIALKDIGQNEAMNISASLNADAATGVTYSVRVLDDTDVMFYNLVTTVDYGGDANIGAFYLGLQRTEIAELNGNSFIYFSAFKSGNSTSGGVVEVGIPDEANSYCSSRGDEPGISDVTGCFIAFDWQPGITYTLQLSPGLTTDRGRWWTASLRGGGEVVELPQFQVKVDSASGGNPNNPNIVELNQFIEHVSGFEDCVPPIGAGAHFGQPSVDGTDYPMEPGARSWCVNAEPTPSDVITNGTLLAY